MTPQFITWIIASVAVLLSGGALTVAIRADRRANGAERSGREASDRELWTSLIAAVQPVIGTNVLNKDMHPLLVQVRSGMMELIDGLERHGYTHLDRWLKAEHQLMTGLFDETFQKLSGKNPSIEEILEAHDRPGRWAAGFIGNLRYARSLASGSETGLKFSKAADQAEENLKSLVPGTTLIEGTDDNAQR